MTFTFDTAKKIWLSPDPFTSRELYAAWKAWVPDHLNLTRALRPTGGDSTGGGNATGSTFFLANDWQMVPHDSNHTLVITGNIRPETDNPNRSDLFLPRTGRTILIRQEMSLLSEIKTVSTGSGVLPSDITSIAATTRDAILSDGTRFAGANIDAAISSAGGLTEPQAAALVELQLRMLELWRLQGLDLANPLHVAAASRTVATIAQTIVETAGTVTVTRTA